MTSEESRAPRPLNTCRSCPATWGGTQACHCAGCHRTFSGAGLFDLHRSAEGEHGTCIDPATITNRSGKALLEFRDGKWRGEQMTPEQIARIWKKDAA